MPLPKPLIFMWVAGIFDCEGYFGVSHSRAPRTALGARWSPTMCVSNTSILFLKTIQERVGMGWMANQPANEATNARQSWRLHFKQNDMRILLPQIIPFLIIKKEQARLLLKALNILALSHGDKYTELEQIHDQICALNARGIHPKKYHHGRRHIPKEGFLCPPTLTTN